MENERGTETMTFVFEFRKDTEIEGEEYWGAKGGTGSL